MKIAYHVPAGVLGNDAFSGLGWSADKILEKTGIEQRHLAGRNEFALDLAEEACKKLLAEFAVDPSEIDFLLYCTQSPDYIVPNNAGILHARLGLKTDTGALDVIQGCTGFIYGLSMAKGLLLTGQVRSLLLVTADTWSKYIHERDRGTRSIFGDGAAATLLTRSDAEKLGHFLFGTDGSGFEHLRVKASGLRFPRGTLPGGEIRDASGNIRTEGDLYMNGPEIFSFTLRTVPPAVRQLLLTEGLTLEDVDLFVFHQANGFMLEHLRRKMGIKKDCFPVVLAETGNTVSSTIPIVLRTLSDRGVLKQGQILMLVGFGVGYSWNAVVFRS